MSTQTTTLTTRNRVAALRIAASRACVFLDLGVSAYVDGGDARGIGTLLVAELIDEAHQRFDARTRVAHQTSDRSRKERR
jgi:hypothetical protein